jgi:hypothetical protein
MATLQNHTLSLNELIKRTNPDGTVANIVDTLHTVEQAFPYMPWVEANMEMAHRFTQVNSEPSGAYVGVGEYAPITRGTSKQVTENLSIWKDYSDIDREEAELASDINAYRNAEDMIHLRGGGKKFMEGFFYNLEGTDLAAYNGLTYRYNALANENVFNAGGSTSLTSIYVIQFGDNGLNMIYPKGNGPAGSATFGIESEDQGLVNLTGTTPDGAPGAKEVYRTMFRIKSGMMIKDPRSVKRIANIDTTLSGLSTMINDDGIDDLLIRAMNELPDMGMGYILMNRRVKSALDIYAKDKSNVNWHYESYAGKRVLMFQEAPILITDSLVNAETAVA